jgi:hypothetical protein
MASGINTHVFRAAFKGDVDIDVDTIKVMLLGSGYTFNKDHDFRDDLGANELAAGGGYTAGGATVTPTATHDTANDRVDVNLPGTTWAASTIGPARYAAYYKARGGAASADELIAIVDFGSDKSSSGGDFVLTASTLRVQG